uniref:Uncharacterized protein n=1 Tax=Anguilla anguilla TaxID=7936 RepID=A0A0E9S6U3_ANGAN
MLVCCSVLCSGTVHQGSLGVVNTPFLIPDLHIHTAFIFLAWIFYFTS